MDHLLSNIDDEIQGLIISVLSGEASSREIQRLQIWINASETNKMRFNEINHAWQVSSSAIDNKRFDAEKAWSKNKHIVNKKFKETNSRTFNLPQFSGIAALFILVFLLGGLVTYFGMNTLTEKTLISSAPMNEVISPRGSKSQLLLPDGTLVWLNAGSKLRYSQSYNSKHRDVYLEGEAYFKVKSNLQKPFVVKTTEMNIKAYGTAFNVKAYPEEKTIITTLVEGKVTAESTNKMLKKIEIALKPNQNLVYYKVNRIKSAEISAETKKIGQPHGSDKNSVLPPNFPVVVDDGVKTDLFTSWKDERWIIEREELDRLVVMLERRFNITFQYSPEELNKYRVSGIIYKETLEQVLDILKLTAPIQYVISEGLVTLKTDEVRKVNFPKTYN